MKYYSEVLNKVFESPKELRAAEEAYEAEVAAAQKAAEEAKAKAAKVKEQRAVRAKECEEAYKAIIEAQKNYNELVNKFIKDYGSFHMTYRDEDGNRSISTVSDLFDFFFK